MVSALKIGLTNIKENSSETAALFGFIFAEYFYI
jgi:hypothetical protein